MRTPHVAELSARIRNRPSLIGLAIVLSLPAASPAMAQSARPARQQSVLEEVIVTARKRSENLQDTPISITAFTARDLQARQLTAIKDLDEATPNLVFDTAAPSSGSNSAATVFIRGIGQVDFTPTTAPGVGIYVDGVYYASAVGSAFDFLDPERIEVLRGPQGTLFGRNTIGGAINIISKRPTRDGGGDVSATFGSEHRIDLTANINMPLSDTLLTKVSLATRNRDGYVRDQTVSSRRFGDRNSSGIRGQVLWMPTDNYKALLAADYTREREESAPNVLIRADPSKVFPNFWNNVVIGNCANPRANPKCFSSAYVGAPDKTDQEQPSASDLDYWGVTLTQTLNLDWMRIKSISAYRNLRSYSTRDADHSPAVVWETADVIHQNQFSQEFQFSGTGFDERLNWLVGLYYFHEHAINRNFIDMPLGFITRTPSDANTSDTFLSGGSVDNDSRAIFAQITYDITRKLSLTLGDRWTRDSKAFTPNQYTLTSVAAPGGIILPPGSLLLPHARKKTIAREWTPMANLSYHWTDRVMTYFTASKGFKSGGFTQRVFPPILPGPGQSAKSVIPSFGPEFVKSYEAGIKTTLLNQRLRINADVFYNDYDDMQVLVRGFVATVTVNAGKAAIKGGELEFTYLPIDGLTITGGIGYLDGRYRKIDPRAIGVTINNALTNAPQWTGSSSIFYEWPIDAIHGSLTPRVDVSYTSKIYHDAINTKDLRQDDVTLINASLTYKTDDGKWRAIAAVRNVTDKIYLTQGSANMNTGGYVEGVFSRPREWSLTIKRNF